VNYPPNEKQWVAGNIVVHDCDAKKPRMLMRVIGRMDGGRYQTEYLDKELQKKWGRGVKSRLINSLCILHDPALFGIDITTQPDDDLYDRDHSWKGGAL
jgi:hypothetical protein